MGTQPDAGELIAASALVEMIRNGDRFRLKHAVENGHISFVRRAPAHSAGGNATIPAGTVVVALDQVPGATAFAAYPEDYDALEELLVPDDVRASPDYRAYALSFAESEIGTLLDPLPPAEPRPGNRLPRPKGGRSRNERA